MMIRYLILVIISSVVYAKPIGIPIVKMERAFSLTVSDQFVNPIGFYDSSPSFSWKLPVSNQVKSQSSYSIVVASDPALLPNKPDVWQSGKVLSNQSIFVPYSGKPFLSKQKLYWQIQYWNQDGSVSEWSEVAYFEMGLLHNIDWKAQWIGITNETPKEQTRSQTPLFVPQYLRKEFTIPVAVKKARLYITAKGLFEAYINGEKIGNDVMVPGWTPYAKRIETLTYDVTHNLVKGNNVIGATLAEGWYAGRIGYKKSQWTNTNPPKLLCQLEIEFSDGHKEIIVSDKSWKASQNGPLRASSIYDGEFYNASLELKNWTRSNFQEKEQWKAVVTEEIQTEPVLQPKRHQPVRTIEVKPTKSVAVTSKGVAVFDIGQNLAGVARVQVPMKKGDTLVIKFAEMLNKDGSLHTDNYRSAHSTDYYIAKENGMIDWHPQFTYHGFQFVQLSGFAPDAQPQKAWVSALVQHSYFEMIGEFTSSSSKLNQLQNNIQWGLKSNFFDVPTDCPQRNERLGFTGDAQVFTRAALQNADLQSFFMAWMQSMREEQYTNNIIPVVIPNIIGEYSESGWSDAAVIIPWSVYRSTGNTTILSENYDMIKRWVAYHQSQSTDYISTMKSVGDWLQPYATAEDARRGDTPHSLISTAYFGHAASLTAQIAAVLGFKEENVYYKKLSENVATAFQNKFFDKNGKLTAEKESQTGYLLALAYDLLSDELKPKATTHLKRLIKESDGHLRTGFLGTPLLGSVLDETGNTALMYQILFKETYPSWFYSINQGATTMWERWNSYSLETGFEGDSMNSLNHYAYGAIGQFLYERIAGIYPLEAGYKKIRIAPIVGAGLTSAEGKISSPYGKITSSWKVENGKFQLNTTIPPNTTAKIVVPSKNSKHLVLDGKTLTDNSNIKIVGRDNDYIELLALSGTYTIETEYN